MASIAAKSMTAQKAGQILDSRHVKRNDLDKISVGFSEYLVVFAPPQMFAERFRGRGVRVEIKQDQQNLVVCLSPDEKSGTHWGTKDRGGRVTLQKRLSSINGVTDQWPRRFSSVHPESAIWGVDGVLRLHLPKNLPAIQEKLRRGPTKKATQVKTTKTKIPEATTPEIPGGNVHQPHITTQMMRNITVGHSTTVILTVDPLIGEKWPKDHGVAMRACMDGERPAVFLRPDPSVRNRWHSARIGTKGSLVYTTQIPLLDVEFEDPIPKFKKTQPFLGRWDGDELCLKLPKTTELKPPKKSVTVIHTRVPPSQHHAPTSETPELIVQSQPEPEVQTPEQRLAAAIRGVNELKREMGDDLQLSVKEDGTIRARIMKEFE